MFTIMMSVTRKGIRPVLSRPCIVALMYARHLWFWFTFEKCMRQAILRDFLKCRGPLLGNRPRICSKCEDGPLVNQNIQFWLPEVVSSFMGNILTRGQKAATCQWAPSFVWQKQDYCYTPWILSGAHSERTPPLNCGIWGTEDREDCRWNMPEGPRLPLPCFKEDLVAMLSLWSCFYDPKPIGSQV
jgi:hypothetical protein